MHLLNLINEILDLSRIEAGRYELNEEAVSLVHVVADCHHLLKLRASSRGITIHEVFEQGMPRIWGDERATRQIVLNLLSNSIKFTPQGGEIWLKVGWTASGGQYLSVKDTGSGIAADEIPIVLASFGQGSNSIKSAEQGAGLGLPIAKSLIDMHGGTFTLKSKLRIGTEVIVTNPNPINGDKTDDQLKTQAEALNVLGGQLASEGIQLAYHTHTPEMKNAAREFHHMMLGTDPGHMGLCLDAHWVFRGAGNSQVALYDIVKLYAFRIRELHLRQSKDGVWTEVLGDGDIDYRPLAALLKEMNFAGPLILEQCVEKGTPRTLSGADRQKQSRRYLKDIFGV